MTNILATIVVTLVTNTASTDNTQYEWVPGACPDKMIGCLVLHYEKGRKIGEPTARTDTETVIERRILQYTFEGRPFEQLLSERQVATTSRTFVLKQQWEPAPPGTPPANPINHYGFGAITNLNFFVHEPKPKEQ